MTQKSVDSEPLYTVAVTGYGAGGEGVARLEDGRVVFIRGAARGDVLDIRLTKELKRHAGAEIVGILTPSPHRIEADCSFYPECGGCDFRHITYDEELDAKLRRLNDSLERIGGLSARANEILRTGQTEGYRNKAVMHSNGNSLGFYRPQSRDVVPIDNCRHLSDGMNRILKSLPTERGVTLRSGRNGMDPPLEEELDGLVFTISGFFQVNTGAALLLFSKVREYASLSKNEAVIDLYCGVGSLTIFAGRDAGYALGIEQNPDAVEAARDNAKLNGMPHIEFINADAERWEAGCIKPDCVIVDPPRKGLSTEVVRKILSFSPKRIVYVSCDPATLARDIKRLETDYSVKDICAVDMFPRTANVECCCLLV